MDKKIGDLDVYQIEKIAYGGEGILRDDQLVVFVPFTAIGDHIRYQTTKKKKSFAHGKVTEIVKKSDKREEPKCKYYQTCRGCQFQHINYQEEQRVKKAFIQEAFAKDLGLSFPHITLNGSANEYYTRTHIRLNLVPTQQGWKLGYVVNETLLEIDECPIFSASPIIKNLIKAIKKLDTTQIRSGSLRLFRVATKSPHQKTPLSKEPRQAQEEEISLDQEEFDIAFSFFPKLPKNRDILRELPQVRHLFFKAPKVYEGEKNPCISYSGKSFTQETFPLKNIGQNSAQDASDFFYYAPYGFLQNNLPLAKKLYQKICDLIPVSAVKILDLYCGLGLLLKEIESRSEIEGKKVELVGIEVSPESIKKAKKNAPFAKIVQADVEKVLDKQLLSFSPDMIILNPPREGISPLVRETLNTSAKSPLVYISCKPSTLTRDIALLTNYRVNHVEGFDFFPKTTHVETLAYLTPIDEQ